MPTYRFTVDGERTPLEEKTATLPDDNSAWDYGEALIWGMLSREMDPDESRVMVIAQANLIARVEELRPQLRAISDSGVERASKAHSEGRIADAIKICAESQEQMAAAVLWRKRHRTGRVDPMSGAARFAPEDSGRSGIPSNGRDVRQHSHWRAALRAIWRWRRWSNHPLSLPPRQVSSLFNIEQVGTSAAELGARAVWARKHHRASSTPTRWPRRGLAAQVLGIGL
jgi:hypothetical protein